MLLIANYFKIIKPINKSLKLHKTEIQNDK